MTPPRWVWAPAALGLAFVLVPLVAVAARVPWGRLGGLLTSESALDALGLSLRTAAASTVLVVALGVPLALLLASLPARVAAALRVVVLVPLVLPPVVSGLALLAAFGRRGLVGFLGGQVAYTTLAVVLAQAFVALPFLVLAVDGALRSREPRLEEVAATLGAGPTTVLRRVTLPAIAPSLATGAVLAFARALGEFGATLTFAGSLQGVTRTLPLEIYLQRELDPDAALALSLLLIAVAVVVVAAVHGRPGHRPRRAAGPLEVRRRPDDDAAACPPPVARPDPAGEVHVQATVTDRDIDLDVHLPAGAVTAVVGPNGSGKSTLLGLVAGTVRPTSGRVLLGGRDLTRTPPHRRGVGVLHQDVLLFGHLRVLDNVAFGPRCHGLPRAAARHRARAELAALGIAHLADRHPATLSGGQAQRVALARALAVDPAVLLLDEPLSALDVDSAAAMREALSRLHLTTLLVTHDAADVRALADRVVVLDAGRVVEQGRADAVRAPFARALLDG